MKMNDTMGIICMTVVTLGLFYFMYKADQH